MRKLKAEAEVELWIDIPGYEGFYQVSTFGRVRSTTRMVKHWRGGLKKSFGKILKQAPGGAGYYTVSLSMMGIISTFSVHRLVLTAFRGLPTSPEYYGLHYNDNPIDNRLENLYWGTQKQNRSDAHRNGRGLFGTKNGNSKLSEFQVVEIRRKYEHEKLTIYDLAAQYHIAATTIYSIVSRMTWKHV